MGADRESTYRIAFDGEAGDIDSVLSALKGKIRSAVAEIKSIASKVDLFSNLQDDVKKAAEAFAATSAKVAELKGQIDSIKGSGGTVGADLAKQFKLAETAAASASREYNNQVTRLTALQSKLSAAGVNTGKLAAEQTRLAVALKEATAAAAQQSSKDLLGFKSLADVGPQITALNAAFNTLRTSGKLSATEIGAAQTLLAEKLAEVRGKVTGVSQSLLSQASTIKSSFSGISLQFLAFTATIGTVVAGIKSVTDEARAFNQGIAEIGAVTTLSKAQLAALGEEARSVARTLGFDVVEGVKQLQEILRAGVPADNAIAVLAQSSEFAKIAQTDLGTAVKLSTTLVKAFGVDTDDLNRVLAIFFQSSKNGGPTLAALSEDLGKLGPIAKSTGTPIEQVSAALQVMVKAGVPASDAMNDLGRLLVKFNSEPARKQLAALGITTTNFVQALAELGDKGGPTVDELFGIGLASQKSVAGVAALTNNSRQLTAALAAQATASADARKALEAFEQTPKERLELLKAAVSDLSITLGDSVGTSSKFAVVLARLLNLFNNLAPTTRDNVAQMGFLSVLFGTFGPLISTVIQVYDRLTTSQSAAAIAASKVADATANSTAALQKSITAIQAIVTAQGDAAKKQLDDARASLQGFATDLQTQISASQAAAAAAITDLNARAAAQIAGLDRSTAAEKATAEATLAIQTKLAADRLALIVRSATDVLKAIDVAGAAQLALVKDNAEKTKAVDLTVNQTKLAALGQYKGQLAAALADAVAQEQGYVAKVNAIDASRIAFNQSVQQQLTDIRNEGLSGFDQYIARTNQINALLAKAQQAFAQGGAAGLALGKTYVDQVIQLSGQLKTVVNADGVAVVSSFEVQQKKIEVITNAAKLYNDALDGQKDAANAGKDASVAAIDAITPKLADITQRYDELAKKVEAGLAIKIALDETSIAEATKKLGDAIAAQEYAAKITADVSAVQAQIDVLVANLKQGVTDGADAQLQGIASALKKIAADAPQLQVKVDDALTQVNSIKVAVEGLKPKLIVDSNVDEVQKSIDKLKLPTESTHTVHIVTDGGTPGNTAVPIPGLARGGPVGAIQRSLAPAREAWQRYANGGAVFPRLSGIKVPGVGNQDTVPAMLQSGAFVMRKAASQFYGDAAMVKLAAGAYGLRMLAGGGFGMNDRGTGSSGGYSPGSGYIGTNDINAQTLEIPAPDLPSDPKQKRAMILRYVYDVAYAAISDDYFYWKSSLRWLNDAKTSYDFAPTDAHLENLLQKARNIGLNLGVKKNTHTGFDVDGRRWHKQLATEGIPAGLLGALTYLYSFYNQGGPAGSDTVPAMLTPGEYVINAPRASELGPSLLHAINDMKVPRASLLDGLSNMMSPQSPRRPQYFADGGMVGDPWSGQSSQRNWSPGSGQTNNFNMSVNPSELFSVDNVRRYLLPVIREIDRRSK